MYSPGPMSTSSAGLDSSELHRKLRESQERQSILLKKIAEKERKLDLSHSIQPTTMNNLSSTSMRAMSPPRASAAGFDPAATAASGIAPVSHATYSLATQLQEEKFLSSPARSNLDFSVHEERFNSSTIVDDESALLRVRQLSAQLRHSKSENARKDILLANQGQQISELLRIQSEYIAAKSAWESRDQQFQLRETEYQQNLTELHATIQSLTANEAALRAAQTHFQKEKLNIERSTTVQLGDMDAKIHSLRSELEQKVLALKQAEYEASLAQRERDRLVQTSRAFEETHISLQNNMEEKYFALKKDHTQLEEQFKNLQAHLDRTLKECQEKESSIENKETELSILGRNKTSQTALIESLNRELSELQIDRLALKALADVVPDLKNEQRSFHDLKKEFRALQSTLVHTESQLQAIQLAHEGKESENNSLKELNASFERNLSDLRDRYNVLTGPNGELDKLRMELEYTRKERQEFLDHSKELSKKLDALNSENADLLQLVNHTSSFMILFLNQSQTSVETHIQHAIREATAAISSPHKRLSASASQQQQQHGSGAEDGPHVFRSEEFPPFIREPLKAACLNFQTGYSQFAREYSQLQFTQKQLLQQNHHLTVDLTETSASLRELEDRSQKEALAWVRELDESKGLSGRLQAELQSQKEDNEALNTQNHTLISELDERLVAVRLWAVEIDSLTNSLDTRSNAGEEPAGRSILGASASPALAEHWPSVRQAFSEVLFLLANRARAQHIELAENEKIRANQVRDINRFSEEVSTLTEQLNHSNETAREAARIAHQSLSDSESLRLSEAQRLTDECNIRCENLQVSYEKIISELQDTNRKNTHEIIELTRVNHNLLTACRLFFKAYKPLHTKMHELSTQKVILMKLYEMGQKEHQEVRELMQAMTGATTIPEGVRALPGGGKKALFRAGVIAVLAFRRFLFGPRRNNTYGQQVQVRGEQFSLLDNTQLSNDMALPVVDDASLSTSAQSLVHLLAHFEPFSDVQRERSYRSLLGRITSMRFIPHAARTGHQSGGVNDEDQTPMGVIRRVALALANRNRQLERELHLSVTESWTVREQSKAFEQDLEAKHNHEAKLLRESLESEQRRVKQLENELAHFMAQQKKLEEDASRLSTQVRESLPAKEAEALKASRDEYARRLLEVESNLAALQRHTQADRERNELNHQLEFEALEAKLNQSHRRVAEGVEENNQLQFHLRKKNTELAALEKQISESSDLHTELQQNLESCMSKNQTLIERIKILETEVSEHRTYSHKLKSTAVQYEAHKGQWELTLSTLQSELREKERELMKSQELIRTLTAATRAATNELDTQLMYSRHQLHQNGSRLSVHTPAPPSAVHHSFAAPAATHHSSPYPAASPISFTQSSASHHSTSIPPAHAGAPTVHLRHHPGGRLSMDVSGGATVLQQQPPAVSSDLRFDELDVQASSSSVSAPPSAYAHRQEFAPSSVARSEARVERE